LTELYIHDQVFRVALPTLIEPFWEFTDNLVMNFVPHTLETNGANQLGHAFKSKRAFLERPLNESANRPRTLWRVYRFAGIVRFISTRCETSTKYQRRGHFMGSVVHVARSRGSPDQTLDARLHGR